MEQGRKRRRPIDGWEEKGGYMNAKVQKLQEQFDKGEHLQLSDAVRSDIFAGVVIHVNGYTDPSSDELKRLVRMHGGGYAQYYSKTKVSHTIATNLTDTKIKALNGDLIVLPEWITQSIAAGRRLDVKPFLLYDQPVTQKTISFPHVATPKNVQQLPVSGHHNVDRTVGLTTSDKDSSAVAGHHVTDAAQSTLCYDTLLTTSRASEGLNVSIGAAGSPMDDWQADSDADDDDEQQDHEAVPDACLPDLPKVGIAAATAASQPSRPELSAGMGHAQLSKTSTHPALKAGESGFVAEFYGHSRLHHLSTWSAELRKFTSMLSDKPALRGLEWRRRHPASGPRARNRTVMHVDMDCFFVAISLRSFPQHVGKPVAVTHGSVPKPSRPTDDVARVPGMTTIGESSISDVTTGDSSRQQPVASLNAGAGSAGKSAANGPALHSSADIASCSYEARAQGVKNGMWLTSAVQLCPELVTVPYDFAAYRVASQSLYEVMTSYSRTIEAVSCDEVFIDVSKLVNTDEEAKLLAEDIRKSILEATGVTASAGIASNVLLARMATRLGKPNGHYLVTEPDILEFIGKQDVGKLPGVGHATTRQLSALGVETCLDLRQLALPALQEQFGPKTGQLLWNHARGKDDRDLRVSRERKSISAEINYGMRFKQRSDVEKFVVELSTELEQRMVSCQMKGHHLCLKMKVKKPTAPAETKKHMGHGMCDNVTRSISLPTPVSDSTTIRRFVWLLIDQLKVEYPDIRGMGIQMQRLVSAEKVGKSSTAPIRAFFTAASRPSEVGAAAALSSVEPSPVLQQAHGNRQTSPFSASSTVAPSSTPALDVSASITTTTTTPVTKRSFAALSGSDATAVLVDESGQTGASSRSTHHTPQHPPLPFLPTQSAYKLEFPAAVHVAAAAESKPGCNASARSDSRPVCSAAAPQHAQASGVRASATGGVPSDFALPALEDLDASVLAALPDDIRRDIELAYQQQRGNTEEGGVSRAALDRETEKLSHSDLFPSTSQLDRSVLATLPPALRAEIMYDHRNFPQHTGQQQELPVPKLQKLPQKQQAAEQKPQVVVHGQQSRSKYHIASSAERQMHLFADPVTVEAPAPSKTYALVAELKGHSELPQVKKVLQDWVLSTDDPEAVDGLIVAKYLAQLTQRYNLQQSWLLLQAFHRMVEKRSSWHFIFNAVLSYCQAEVKVQWESHLPLKPFSIGSS